MIPDGVEETGARIGGFGGLRKLTGCGRTFAGGSKKRWLLWRKKIEVCRRRSSSRSFGGSFGGLGQSWRNGWTLKNLDPLGSVRADFAFEDKKREELESEDRRIIGRVVLVIRADWRIVPGGWIRADSRGGFQADQSERISGGSIRADFKAEFRRIDPGGFQAD